MMKKLIASHLNRLVPLGLMALAAVALLVPAAANATPYVVKLSQQGSNVVATGSGAFDLTGLTFFEPFGAGPFGIQPNVAEINLGASASGLVIDGYTGLTGPVTFGSGGVSVATTGTGDTVDILGSNIPGYGGPFLWVPTGYASGTSLSSTATWDNATIASLGVTPGTYVWTWGNGAEQSFTLDIGATMVPEPAALGLFGFGLLLIGSFVSLRRRKALGIHS